LLIWQAGPPRRGRPAEARQAVDVQIAIGRSTVNASVYHILSSFLPFSDSIADKHVILFSKE
jgi:hypothetical protein